MAKSVNLGLTAKMANVTESAVYKSLWDHHGADAPPRYLMDQHKYSLFLLATVVYISTPILVGLNIFAANVIQWAPPLRRLPIFQMLRWTYYSEAVPCLLYHPYQITSQLVTWYYGEHPPMFYCRLFSILVPINVAGLSAQLLMGLNRFTAVYFPFAYRRIFTLENVKWQFALCVVPGLVFLTAVPRVWGDVLYIGTGACYIDGSYKVHLWLISMVVAWIQPTAAFFLYLLVYIRVLTASSPASKVDLQKRARGTLMLCYISVVHTAFVTPAPILVTFGMFDYAKYGYTIGWSLWLRSLSFGVNVVSTTL